MRVVILDGSPGGAGDAVAERVASSALAAGAEVERFRPGELGLAPCQGDFECWVKTPGLCRAKDQARDICQAMQGADLVVYATPVVFGGHASALKRAIDRQIGLVEPFFLRRDGLTRHTRRYERYPAQLYLGWTHGPAGTEAAAIFGELARGNAANLWAPWWRAELLDLDDAGWPAAVAAALQAGLGRAPWADLAGGPTPQEVLQAACAADAAVLPAPPTSVTLLVGSARPAGGSTSESLGQALLEGLRQGGVAEVRVVRAMSFLKDGAGARAALEALLASELLVVSAPLYVDTLPALALAALERVAAQLRAGPAALRSVVGVLNCGFPEAVHTRTGVRVLRAFARESGLAWAGGLAMGAGEAVHGRPLRQVGGLVRHQVAALALAAEHLARGQAVPAAASELMSRGLMPPVLYRLAGGLGWRRQAGANGLSVAALHARPLEARA